jgi:hypothetical protein
MNNNPKEVPNPDHNPTKDKGPVKEPTRQEPEVLDQDPHLDKK